MTNLGRFAALAVLVLVLAGPAAAQSPRIHVAAVSRHVVQGTDARIVVRVRPANVSCTLRVRYRGGALQPGLARVVARHGVASWTWTVPTGIQAGAAQAKVSCGRAGSLTRQILIVGRLIAPKIDVVKSGFSTRQSTTGSTRLNYGIILHNESGSTDATKVTVQTNFVLADNHLLGTDAERLAGIGAGSDFAVSSTVSFPAAAPIVRLEIVVQVTEFAPHQIHLPTLANIHIVPNLHDPGHVGSIEGEIQNTDASQTLQRTALTAVVLDSGGNIVGGTTGSASQTLPPGARSFIKLTTGLDVIPTVNAASVIVSMSPTWGPPA
ncbi:MAG TPA: hypothetical protein VH416_01025 [Gaiellaceae bacterium]